MEEEVVAQLHQLFEAARPSSLSGDDLQHALKELFDAVVPHFDQVIRRPDGSRICQLLFRRGNAELRTNFLGLFQPKLEESIKTKYSCHIVEGIIKSGTTENRKQILHSLSGKFASLLSHRIAGPIISLLFENLNMEQKISMANEFLSIGISKSYKDKSAEPKQKDLESLITSASENQISNLNKILTVACDKGNGKLKLTQVLLRCLTTVSPQKKEAFLCSMPDIAMSFDGSKSLIQILLHSDSKPIAASLRILEPKTRKPMIEGQVEPQKQEGDEEAEEGEGAEEDAEEEDKNEKQNLNNTSKLACDVNGWRVLACAISCLTDSDLAVISEEVIPNILDNWDSIKLSKSALSVLIRMLASVPSVFQGLNFQKAVPSEALKQMTAKAIIQKVTDDIVDLSQIAEGSRIIVEIMNYISSHQSIFDEEGKTGKDIYENITTEVFQYGNLTDKVMHKLLRQAVKSDSARYSELVKGLITKDNMAEVLKSVGAWVLVEICGTDEQYRSKVLKAIKENKIESEETVEGVVLKRPAIEALEHPEGKPEKPLKRKRN